MTLYSLVLFAHVVSAIGLFVGLALEGFVFLRIRGARDAKQMQFFIGALDRLRWIFIPSFAGILVGGLYLASHYGRGAYWIPAALFTTLAMMLVGGLITGRQQNQLKKALQRGDETFETLSFRAKGTLLTVSYGLRIGINRFRNRIPYDSKARFVAIGVCVNRGLRRGPFGRGGHTEKLGHRQQRLHPLETSRVRRRVSGIDPLNLVSIQWRRL